MGLKRFDTNLQQIIEVYEVNERKRRQNAELMQLPHQKNQ